MNRQDETKWLCENAHSLEKFSGQWVMFSVREGVVSKSDSLNKVLRMAAKRKMNEKPFVFHVPSREECGTTLPMSRKK